MHLGTATERARWVQHRGRPTVSTDAYGYNTDNDDDGDEQADGDDDHDDDEDDDDNDGDDTDCGGGPRRLHEGVPRASATSCPA